MKPNLQHLLGKILYIISGLFCIGVILFGWQNKWTDYSMILIVTFSLITSWFQLRFRNRWFRYAKDILIISICMGWASSQTRAITIPFIIGMIFVLGTNILHKRTK